MAVGTTSAILIGAGIAGAGTVASSMISANAAKKSFSSAPMALPQPPNPSDAVDKAGEAVKKKKSAMSKTIYTSPLGVAGEADVARKTLLGQ